MDFLDQTLAVPDELLVRTFALLELYQHERPAALMALAAVCRRWNRLAYDGSLWTHISITHITTVTQLCFQLERSASRLLEVSIWLQPLHFTTKLREQCQTVLSEYWRVQDLDIDTFGPVGDPWPQELTAPLTSGKTWPHLLSLSLIDSSSDVNAVLQLDVDAPKLKTLVLEAVSTRQWPTLPRPALQSIQLRELGSASGIADAITNCPDLRHLDLRDNGEEHSAQTRSLHFPLPRSPTKLVNLDITWMTVDLKQLMSFLAFCPRLERLCLEVTTFDGYGDTLITDFRLPSLEVLRLELHDRPPSKPRILTALLPVVNAEKLRALTLSFVDMGSCEAILGGNLEDLSLTGIRCDAANLVRALSQCQQLRTLILHDLEISALDESLAEHAQRLPALRNASLTGYQSASVAGFVPDVQAENRCLVRLFLALVDGQGIPSLHIGVPLAAQEVAHICSELGDHDSMSLEVQDTWRGTRFKIGTAHRPPPHVPRPRSSRIAPSAGIDRRHTRPPHPSHCRFAVSSELLRRAPAGGSAASSAPAHHRAWGTVPPAPAPDRHAEDCQPAPRHVFGVPVSSTSDARVPASRAWRGLERRPRPILAPLPISAAGGAEDCQRYRSC